jgi:hypothetical protein
VGCQKVRPYKIRAVQQTLSWTGKQETGTAIGLKNTHTVSGFVDSETLSFRDEALVQLRWTLNIQNNGYGWFKSHDAVF